MRVSIFIFLTLLLFSCTDNRYNKLEFKAIQDISNDYLRIKDLNQSLIKPGSQIAPDTIKKQNNYKVFISDALLPISQAKENNRLMFDIIFKNENPHLDSIANSIVDSKNFKRLKYRKFNKSRLEFANPYRQFVEHKSEIGKDEEYVIISFSRICFSADDKYGLVVIDYEHVWPNGTGVGFNRPYLIEKKNNEWKVINE
ncbi:hypothetical protein KO566_10605 [Flavobacteriaceae bacterium XHP0103]|uniref:hypothetical protein n=1 Tax=Marixanthotalea marina TaxID=2844359 RepID=UPI002989BDCB|nr:hypothetical protein [Marixanthotalea marina]MBU3822514.1 hypothetical protein [Marixanthotalea marina]